MSTQLTKVYSLSIILPSSQVYSVLCLPYLPFPGFSRLTSQTSQLQPPSVPTAIRNSGEHDGGGMTRYLTATQPNALRTYGRQPGLCTTQVTRNTWGEYGHETCKELTPCFFPHMRQILSKNRLSKSAFLP